MTTAFGTFTFDLEVLRKIMIGRFHSPLFSQQSPTFVVRQPNPTSTHDRRFGLEVIAVLFYGVPFPRPTPSTPFPMNFAADRPTEVRDDESSDMLFSGLVLFPLEVLLLGLSSLVEILDRTEGATLSGNPNVFGPLSLDQFQGFPKSFR